MDKTKEERKSALKLINKYAESYNILEEENKHLKNEINDLKLNLKINKEIIESFYSGKSKAEISSIFKRKMKEENQNYMEQIQKLNKEKDELRYKQQLMEQMYEESVESIKTENEKMKSKLFIMDNCLTKKDNIIQQLKRKMEGTNVKDNTGNTNANEIYITDPTETNLKLSHELMIYKEIYIRLMTSIKELKSTLFKYERLIQELQIENSKLTHEMKFQLNQKYEKEREDLDYSSSAVTAVRVYNNKSINNIKEQYINKSANDIQFNRPTLFNRKYYELEEWWTDALRNSNMDENDFKRFKGNKAFAKIVDLIEFLNNIILDKVYQIKFIEKENHALSDKNEAMNKENLSLYEKLRDFANTKDTGGDSSMNNNASNNMMAGISNSRGGLGLLKAYQATIESFTSNDFRDGNVDDDYFTNESILDQMNNISIS
jgi:hypothetical protein